MATKKPTFDAHRAAPGETFEFADAAGKLHTVSADTKGVIRPKNGLEANALAHLPVARAAAKSSSTKRSSKRSSPKKAAAAPTAPTEPADEPRER